MPETNLVTQLALPTVALSESEYHAATILGFDPEAYLSPGQFSGDHPEPRDRLLAGDAMTLRGWTMLARACGETVGHQDDRARLETFLAERATAPKPPSSPRSARACGSAGARASAATAMPAAKA